jgi:hypothetical protein
MKFQQQQKESAEMNIVLYWVQQNLKNRGPAQSLETTNENSRIEFWIWLIRMELLDLSCDKGSVAEYCEILSAKWLLVLANSVVVAIAQTGDGSAS